MNALFTAFFIYLQKGGVVNSILFVLCSGIAFIGFRKLDNLRAVARATTLTERLQCIAPDLPGQLVAALNHRRLSQGQINELLLYVVPRLEAGLDTMAGLISAAPLLGLLGTVIGMIQTFSIIMHYGVGNPGLLSEGISVALITTQAGLMVSFPGLFFHNYLLNKSTGFVNDIVDRISVMHQGNT